MRSSILTRLFRHLGNFMIIIVTPVLLLPLPIVLGSQQVSFSFSDHFFIDSRLAPVINQVLLDFGVGKQQLWNKSIVTRSCSYTCSKYTIAGSSAMKLAYQLILQNGTYHKTMIGLTKGKTARQDKQNRKDRPDETKQIRLTIFSFSYFLLF